MTNVESNLVQFCNYFGYFLMALPAGVIARTLGYKGGILTGLGLVAAGAFWFIPATALDQYWAFLLGLFIVACGLACLETIANPYTTVLGRPETAATRINLAQICNAVGASLAPYISGLFILSATSEANTSNSALYLPYMIIGSMVVILLVCFAFASVPDVGAEGIKTGKYVDTSAASPAAIKKGNEFYILLNLGLAVLAQFLYVAAQVGLNAYIMPFANSPKDMPPLTQEIANMLPVGSTAIKDGICAFTERGASLITTAALVLFLLGRMTGTLFISRLSAHTTLAVFGGANVLLMVLTVLPLGWISFFSLMLAFYFMSIMFPTIFALGIRGLGEYTKLGSSLIVMSIVGGALLPFLMGYIADLSSYRYGFIVPLFCFLFVMIYALMFPWLQRQATGHEVED